MSGHGNQPAQLDTEEGEMFLVAYYREGGPSGDAVVPRRIAGVHKTSGRLARSAAVARIRKYDPSGTIIPSRQTRARDVE